MAKNYFEYVDKGYREAEKHIDRDNSAHLNFMRNDIVNKHRLTKQELDMYINSLLTDPVCKNEITDGYKMSDADKRDDEFHIAVHGHIPEAVKSLPCYWIDSKKNDTEEMRKISNIRKRFWEQKKNNTYKKHPDYKNKEEYENKYKATVSKFDTRDVTLNQIFEFSIRDLLEDILKELKGKNGIIDIKIIKTNEYDDVSAKTDYIIKVEYPNKESYKALDLTTSNNSQTIEEKKKLKEVFCPNFHFNEKIKVVIPRSLLVIEDKEFVFAYMRKYMQQIQMTGQVQPKQALKIRESTGEKGKKIKNEIKNQLLKNIGVN